MFLPLVISLAIHCGLAYLVLPLGDGQGGDEKRHLKQAQKDGASVGGESERKAIHVPGRVVVKEGSVEGQEKSGGGEDCEHYYFGIGVMMELIKNEKGRCILTSVAKGGPADRAGIKAGDSYLLVGEEGCIIKGEEGSPAQLKLWRGDSGEAVSLLLIRERICTDEVQPK